jgi:hypothetical protein
VTYPVWDPNGAFLNTWEIEDLIRNDFQVLFQTVRKDKQLFAVLSDPLFQNVCIVIPAGHGYSGGIALGGMYGGDNYFSALDRSTLEKNPTLLQGIRRGLAPGGQVVAGGCENGHGKRSFGAFLRWLYPQAATGGIWASPVTAEGPRLVFDADKRLAFPIFVSAKHPRYDGDSVALSRS